MTWMFSPVVWATSHKPSDSAVVRPTRLRTAVGACFPPASGGCLGTAPLRLLRLALLGSGGAAAAAEGALRWGMARHSPARRSTALLPALEKHSEPSPAQSPPAPAEQPRAALASFLHRGAMLPAILAIPKPGQRLQLFLGVRLRSTRRRKAAQRWHLCRNIGCGTPVGEQMGRRQRGHGNQGGVRGS